MYASMGARVCVCEEEEGGERERELDYNIRKKMRKMRENVKTVTDSLRRNSSVGVGSYSPK